MLVLSWRNEPKIATFMKNKKIDLKEHLEFCENLKRDKAKKYFLVFENEKPVGVIYFVDIEKEHCEFGLYQNPNLKGKGRILMREILGFAKINLKLKNLYARVYKNNAKALALYEKNGFKCFKQDDELFYLRLDKI